jgi:hypothetical protein
MSAHGVAPVCLDNLRTGDCYLIRVEARRTAARQLRVSFLKRLAMRLKCLSLLKQRSMSKPEFGHATALVSTSRRAAEEELSIDTPFRSLRSVAEGVGEHLVEHVDSDEP